MAGRGGGNEAFWALVDRIRAAFFGGGGASLGAPLLPTSAPRSDAPHAGGELSQVVVTINGGGGEEEEVMALGRKRRLLGVVLCLLCMSVVLLVASALVLLLLLRE